MKRGISLAIATGLLSIALVGVSAAATYTVKSGDTLSGIATSQKVEGGWQALYTANKSIIGSNPNLIQVGQVLTLPTATYPPTPRTGVYVGPGSVSKYNTFDTWLNRSQLDATDYVDPSENATWNITAFKTWGDWKKAEDGRKFILGLPLLPKQGNFTDGLAGKYDSQFRGVAKLMVQNGLGDSIIRLGYEPNNPNIGPWQGTKNPSAYKAMFRRVYGIMKAEAPGFKFDYNSAVGPAGLATSFDSLYPGDAYVDIVGLNVYDVWWAHYSATAYDRWQHNLNTTMGINSFKAFAKAHNKPVSYPEWGLYKKGDSYAGGGDSPYFIDRMAELVQGSTYNAYFNMNWGGGTLDNFPNGKLEYKKKFGNQ